MNEIKSLTAMRGIFALWVLAYHIEGRSGMPRGIAFMSYGYLGVDFFFLLSGFILAGAYGATFSDCWKFRDFGRFLVRRVRRIFPLHWAVLAVAIAIAVVEGSPPALWPMVREITLTHMWSEGVPRINGLDWTLSTELAANVILPILAVLTLKGTRQGQYLSVATLVVAVVTLLTNASDHGWSLDDVETPPAMVRCICEFTIGMLIYRWHRTTALLSSDLVLSAVAILLIGLVALRAGDVAIALTMAVGLFGLAGNIGRFADVLSIRPLHYLGKISFSLYLVQAPVLWLIRRVIGDLSPASGRYWIFGLTAILGTIAVSHLTYTYIELRFKNLRRQSAHSLAPEDGPAAGPLPGPVS
jgi:peptidoglycan/LPS O-acetylase OafA/YrhL